MTFEDKVKFIRSLPIFKVAPINEVRAVAFAARENSDGDAFTLTSPTSQTFLTLSREDIEKILHEYPHLESVLK